MNINKSIKPETQVILNARRNVIRSLLILLIWLFIGTYFLHQQYFEYGINNAIHRLVIIIHALFCIQLYNAISISKKTFWGILIAVLIIGLSWFYLGIGTLILTIYLIVKSTSVLKKDKK
jgi:hypothetical protein